MSIRAKLLVTFVAIILLVAMIMGISHYRLLEGYFRRGVAAQLARQGPQLQALIEATGIPATDTPAMRRLAITTAAATQSRALVTDAKGVVLVDSAEGRGLTGEIISQALIGRTLRGGIDAFDFPAAGSDAVAVSIPWVTNGWVTGSLIMVRSVRVAVRQVTAETGDYVLRAAVLASAIAAAVAYFLSSTITNPLRKMAQVAKSISKGSFEEKVEVSSSDELGDLAEAMNSMSHEISVLFDSLTQEKEKLQTLMDERTNMISDISHDLRTPITSIRGFVEALRDGIIKDEAEKTRTLDIIHEESERLARLVDDLFYLARLESGEVPVEMEELDLGPVLTSCVKTILPLAMSKHVDVVLEPGAGAGNAGLALAQVTVVGSADRLARAIVNILDNAVKYSPDGGEVRIGSRIDGEKAVVYVADQGPGIAEQDIPHVFERSYRADKARSRAKSGTGLGLSIANLIVEQHGGSMWVESTPGKGATFFIGIPLRP